VTGAIEMWAFKFLYFTAKVCLADVLDDVLPFLHLIIFAMNAAMESIVSCGLNNAGLDLRFDCIRSLVDVLGHSGKNSPLISHINLKLKKNSTHLIFRSINFHNNENARK
jgi:hypothetical protein